MACKCVRCGEEDDVETKTGACIDGRYYCQTCYEVRLYEVELRYS